MQNHSSLLKLYLCILCIHVAIATDTVRTTVATVVVVVAATAIIIIIIIIISFTLIQQVLFLEGAYHQREIQVLLY